MHNIQEQQWESLTLEKNLTLYKAERDVGTDHMEIFYCITLNQC